MSEVQFHQQPIHAFFSSVHLDFQNYSVLITEKGVPLGTANYFLQNVITIVILYYIYCGFLPTHEAF